MIFFSITDYLLVVDNVKQVWKGNKYTNLPITAWSSSKSLVGELTLALQRLTKEVMPSIDGIGWVINQKRPRQSDYDDMCF